MPATSICERLLVGAEVGREAALVADRRARGRGRAASSSARGRPRRPCAAPRRSVGAPTGTTMNSWKSTLLSACAPPLRTFIIGTGSDVGAPRRRGSGTAAGPPRPRRRARRRARRRGSRSRRGAPCSACRRGRSARGRARLVARVAAVTASAISPLTLATACVTPLPTERVAAVAQLDRLELAGRRARRHGRAAGRARAQRDLDLDGRVAAAVEDLAGVDAARSGSCGRDSLQSAWA